MANDLPPISKVTIDAEHISWSAPKPNMTVRRMFTQSHVEVCYKLLVRAVQEESDEKSDGRPWILFYEGPDSSVFNEDIYQYLPNYRYEAKVYYVLNAMLQSPSSRTVVRRKYDARWSFTFKSTGMRLSQSRSVVTADSRLTESPIHTQQVNIAAC